MQTCPACGFHNVDTRERCLKCRAILSHQEGMPHARFKNLNLDRPDRISAIRRGWGRVTEWVAAALTSPLPTGVPWRYPMVGAFLGLLPGLGQWYYNRQPKKAVYLFVVFVILVVCAAKWITTPWVGTPLVILSVGWMLFSFTDALVTAARINGGDFTLRKRFAAMTYPYFLFALIALSNQLLTFVGWPVAPLYRISQEYMAPALEKGDRVCCEGVSYWFRDPKPGDVVRYDPSLYRVEVVTGGLENDQYLINPLNGFERVMAVGGETLEYRGGEFYVDGRKLAQSYRPLLCDQVFDQFKIVCPPDKYLILISSRAADNGWRNQLRGAAGQVPRFDSPGVIVMGWEKACIVEEKDIFARVMFLYHPAERRRLFQAVGPRFAE